jgi:hypothetical protein
MEAVVKTFLDQKGHELELEARYLANEKAKLSRSAYQRVVKALSRRGFTVYSDEKLLRVSLNNKCRVQITGLSAIQRYMADDKLTEAALFERKRKQSTVDSPFGVRLALSSEERLEEAEVQRIRHQWPNSGKRHRIIHRVRLTHKDFKGWIVDCSIVRACYEVVYKASDCRMGPEDCEVEVEASPGAAETLRLDEMMGQLNAISTLIVGAVQNTAYPITYTKMAAVLEEYRTVVGVSPEVPEGKRFVGPNMVALQLSHLYHYAPPTADKEEAEEEEILTESNTVNILNGYTVTDKADGDRKLLFVDGEGAVYFITARMGVESCNVQCPEAKRSVLDGEYVETDRKGQPLSLYAVFDAYVWKGEDVRMRPLLVAGEGSGDRLGVMREAATALEKKMRTPISVKRFYHDKNIFAAAAKCLASELEYATDGLVFTPAAKGVGVGESGKRPPNKQSTWNLCLKWKPDITIDFKVHVAEALGDKSVVHLGVLCRGGRNFDRPQLALLEQTTAQPHSGVGVRPFVTDEDPYSHLAYVPFRNGSLVTDDGEPFQNGNVVEFAYDASKPDMWKWHPVRVRRDKEFPNSFETAHNNFESIMKPVTRDMISGVATAPKDDRYYTGDRKAMRFLRLFHGYVKREVLAFAAANVRKESAAVNLFDLGVGQGGDLWRWRDLNFNLCFGVDVSAHNIHNKQTGACIRYLKTTTKSSHLRVLFAVGDVCEDLFSETGEVGTELDRLIVRGVFGKVPREKVEAYPNLAAHYNTSFQISAAMFVVHYAFESAQKLAKFADNVAACTALGGFFVGTAWDGSEVFERLKDVPKNIPIAVDDVRITKLYSASKFEGTPAATGFGIEVAQSTFTPNVEFLVDFGGLEKVLKTRGFALVHLKRFDTYYKTYIDEKHPPITATEQEVSFWNRAFVFKKIE